MPPLTSPFRVLARAFAALVGVTAFADAARAESLLPPERLALDSVAGLPSLPPNWKLAGGLAGDPRHDAALAAAPGTGVLICNPVPPAGRGHLVTPWEHGDLELDLDFLLAPGGNTGLYLQSRYELQLCDSWGVKTPTVTDCGAIFPRRNPAPGQERFEGTAPRANACRAPGLWQHVHVEFQAPRFDAAGKKTRNARFVKVVLNGFTIQENAEVTGPTDAAAFTDEKPLGPLLIKGDQKPFAIRKLTYKRFDATARLDTENLAYQLYNGSFGKVGEYDGKTPSAAGKPARFAHSAVEKNGKFALVFTGSLIVPREGDYAFSAETNDPARLTIDGIAVVTPLERGSQPGVVTLKAGKHPFRVDLVHAANNRPAFELLAEGPGFALQPITAGEARGSRGAGAAIRQILLEPTDGRVRMQRGFVPYEPKKRLYATSVGTPAGVHFAYDLETGAILRVWRGTWLDTEEMWDNRGEPQLAKPTGPSLTLNAFPTVAFIENPRIAGWPETADAMQSSQGYILEADGLPVFLSKLSDLSIRDRIAPAPDGKGLVRRLEFKGSLPSWEGQVLLAEADQITPQPDGKGWVIGDRDYYIDWPTGAAQSPALRTVDGKRLLVVRLAKSTLEAPLTYSLIW